MKKWVERFRQLRNENARLFSALAFVLGFIFDVFTLGRIDDWMNIAQQVLWLALLGGILLLEFFQDRGEDVIPRNPHLKKLWGNRDLFTQFFFGSLLSTYAIFYFKSASFISSLVFSGIFGTLLVLNETSRLTHSAVFLRVALYTFCISSFLNYFVPMLFGKVGPFPFLVSQFSVLALAGLGLLLIKRRWPDHIMHYSKVVLLPSLVVIGAVNILYGLRWIPPVPVSVQYMGIYHGIEKSDGHYFLLHERPWWKFWENGDQTFYAWEGDQIYCFARIFAPVRFGDEVLMHWLRYDERRGEWVSWDRIPIRIIGGRDQGFRGYTFKENYEHGSWQCRIESRDQREIGRISFKVFDASTYRATSSISIRMTRNFKRDLQ